MIAPTNKQNSKKPISVQNPPNNSDHKQNHNDCASPTATTLLFYLFEPILFNDSHYSKRHWTFVKESIVDINKSLDKYKELVSFL